MNEQQRIREARCARWLQGALIWRRRGCSLRERAPLPWDGPAAGLPGFRPSAGFPVCPEALFGAAARLWRVCLSGIAVATLAACGTPQLRSTVERAEPAAAAVPAPVARPAPPASPYILKKGGGYYQDDGPGDNAPADLDAIPDAVPRDEPLHRFANNPYSVLGRDYVPLRSAAAYKARGVASWYGRKFHGQKTSSGEPYDMYGMTAAHPTLPIPSYARISNPANGRAVIVRINDRGPFHAGRLIDLSYTAAWKLGYIGNGSTVVDVESLAPGVGAMPAQAASAEADPIARIVEQTADAAPLPEVRDQRGHYLQLGAFGNRDNAESLKARLARELGNLGEKLVVQAAGNIYRLQLGPWADALEAHRVAARLRDALELKPLVIQR